MRPNHTSPRSPGGNTIRPDANRPDGMTPLKATIGEEAFVSRC